MTLLTITEILRDAPIESKEFITAIEYLVDMMTNDFDGDEKVSHEAELEVVRNRFRDGEKFKWLAERFSHCIAIAIFLPEIKFDAESVTTGPMAKINTFAALHAKQCVVCGLLVNTETLIQHLQQQLGIKTSLEAGSESKSGN